MTIAERIQKDIDTNRVMLYMKGTPEMPMCGFSRTVVDILKHLLHHWVWDITDLLLDVMDY